MKFLSIILSVFIILLSISLVNAGKCSVQGYDYCWESTNSDYPPSQSHAKVWYKFVSEGNNIYIDYGSVGDQLYFVENMKSWSDDNCFDFGCSPVGDKAFSISPGSGKHLLSSTGSYKDCPILMSWDRDDNGGSWSWISQSNGWIGSGNCLNLKGEAGPGDLYIEMLEDVSVSPFEKVIQIAVSNKGESEVGPSILKVEVDSKVKTFDIPSLVRPVVKFISFEHEFTEKGTYILTVTADSTNIIDESDETNNVRTLNLEVTSIRSVCGNNICESDETFESCSNDCKEPIEDPVCGDSICESSETFESCPNDCPNPSPSPSPSPEDGLGLDIIISLIIGVIIIIGIVIAIIVKK